MVNITGDFPHKTVATRAGLGWIGQHCQLITRPFGSWIRWEKEHCFQLHKGHNCGICPSVCPYGLKALKRK